MITSRRSVFLGGALSHVTAQGISVVMGLLSVPIGLHYLGLTKYGVWVVIQSLMVYLSTSQFGIGNAAAALVAKTDAKAEQRVVLSWALFFLLVSAFLFICITAFAALYPNAWTPVLGKIQFSLQEEATLAVLTFAVLYLLRLPFVTFTSGFIGLQEVYLERLYVAVLPVVSNLLALLMTAYMGGGLVMLAFLTGLSNLVISVSSGLHFFLRHKNLVPRGLPHFSQRPIAAKILSSGGYFFIAGLAAMLVWHTDNLVISYYLGPDHVAAYAVTFKLFTVAYAVFIVINSALWPMYGKAVGENDWAWVDNTYRQSTILLPLLGGLVWIGGIAFSREVILLWAGPSGYGGELVVFALGGYGYLLALVNTHANLLGAINAPRILMWAGILEAVVNLALSLILVRVLGIGGVALGTFLATLVTVFWLLPHVVDRQTEGKVKMAWHPVAKHALLAVLPGVGMVSLLSSYNCCDFFAVIMKFALILGYLVLSWYLLPKDVTRKIKSIVDQRRII